MTAVPTPTILAYIALGSNLGNPIQQLDLAALAIGAHPQITRLAMSPIYQSKPHGDIVQPDFINAVMSVTTTLSAHDLLDVLHDIENQQGRQRNVVWGPRTLDLDLILFADAVLKTPSLIIPHPRAHEREFVIQPLVDLNPELIIPGKGRVSDLLTQLPTATMEIIRNVTTYHH